ncbi:GntR family transcriptional regulator [Halobacillus salinarum]|uniref:GntR family transcriptional regulator n=1 Tax=Halobacillus salinarum TaxID=2932257 RepID=A0ABY4ENY8_9BACI|nr:GntR family transcriptional regulator [Halobacillus salinarum]UOQ46165.1 GntR family transcriptional regulator [Halobacillus salinarum]
MSVSSSEQKKAYEGVLHQLKSYIEDHQLKPGDKLPSERELSDLLHVGRSSIREAFRAMELLGLIETRRGEGTFMRAYRPYHMVELLSHFLLNNTRTRDELVTAKKMLEKEILMIHSGKLTPQEQKEVESYLQEPMTSESHEQMFYYLYKLSNQELLLSMWQFITWFTGAVHEVSYSSSWYENMLQVLKSGKPSDVLSLYEHM